MAENATILIVEDEDSIRSFIALYLKKNGFEVLEASNSEEALEKIKTNLPDLAVLDIVLPGMSGLELCSRLREEYPQTAVIMLTALGQDTDKIFGLELGADDYLVKPFNMLELLSRIKAILRRTMKDNKKDNIPLFSGPFKIDSNAQIVCKNGCEIELTPKEFCLFKSFIENPNIALSRDELLNLVWGKDFFGDTKTLDVHIRKLREKIEDDPSSPRFIETVWGYGYRWREGSLV